MSTTLIRSRSTITQASRTEPPTIIADGAVLQEDGVIAAVGTYDALHRRYPDTPVLGTGNEILIPAFVNGHHHVGLTPVQLGSPDMPLELWFITRMVARNLNVYLDTLYSAFEMVGSGITTVQHIHGWLPGHAGRGASASPTTSSAPTRISACGCPTATPCVTRTGSCTRTTQRSSPRCRRSCAARCRPGSTASK